MAKVTSLQGKANGKVGSIVYSVAAGQQIAREYQPNVANPNTAGQVAQRAKLKLASQLSAALAPVIAIPKEGLKSSRNLFIKKNIKGIFYSGGTAQVSYENLQLTNGNTGFPAIEAQRVSGTGITVNVSENVASRVARVVYIVYKKSSEQMLEKVADVIESTPGENGKFSHSFPEMSGDIIIYAYGMKDNNANAAANYANYQVATGEDIAKLVAGRSISTSDYTLTQTRGLTLFSGDTESVAIPDGSHMVYITAGAGGSVSGTGFENGRKIVAEGASVSVTATPASGYYFGGWFTQSGGQQTLVSNSATYEFTMGQNNVDLVAVFHDNDDPSGFEGA